MTTAAIATLERALQLDDIAEIRAGIAQALGSLRQSPRVLNGPEVSGMVNRAIRTQFDGNAAAAARAWGTSRQSLFSFLAGERPCPPPVLRAIGLRRKRAGRDLYEEV
jgi:hypothetical protein